MLLPSKTAVLSTFGLILLVGITNYLSLKRFDQEFQSSPSGVYIQGVGYHVNILQMSALGLPDYQINLSKIIHYSDQKDRLFNIQMLKFSTLSNTKNITQSPPPWHLDANEGWSYQDQSQIDLWNQVHAYRTQTQTTVPIDIKTQKISYFPKKDLLKTSDLVLIQEPGTQNITHGTGLIGHPNAQKFELLSNINSLFSPPSASPANKKIKNKK